MWDKASLHDLIESKMTDYQMIVVANREPYVHRYVGDGARDRVPAPGQRHGRGARPGDAGRGRRLGRARLGGRRPRDCRRPRPRAGASRGPELHPAARLADQGSRRRAITTAWPTTGSGRCATSRSPGPSSSPSTGRSIARSTHCSATPSWRKPDDRPTFVFIQDYHFAPAAALSQGTQSQPDRRPVLAHPLAQPRDVSRLSLEGGAAGRPAGQRPARFPSALSLPELHGDRRPHDRSRGSTTSRPRSSAKARSTLVRPFPISIDFDRHAGAGRQHRGRAGNQAAAAAAATGAASIAGHRHRADRLHQGHPGTPAGPRPVLRTASRIIASA